MHANICKSICVYTYIYIYVYTYIHTYIRASLQHQQTWAAFDSAEGYICI